MKKLRYVALGIVLLLLFMPIPQAVGQSGITTFDNVTVISDLSVGDDLTVSEGLIFNTAATVTVTQDGTITPDGFYQPVEAASAVSAGSITAGTAGQLLVITNINTPTVVLSDTTTLQLHGRRMLNQYDSLLLVSDGTRWLDLSPAPDYTTFSFSSQAQADADGVHTLYVPVDMTLVGIAATAEAFTGSPTGFNIDIQDDGSDIVTAMVANTAGTPGTWRTPALGGYQTPVSVAAGSEIEVDINLTGGSSPTADYDVTLWFVVN